MVKLEELLRQRATNLLGSPVDTTSAQRRLKTSIRLWETYPTFTTLRRWIESPGAKPAPTGYGSTAVLDLLVKANLLVRANDGSVSFFDDAARRYVMGGWLEELCYFAMLESGAEAALLSQRVGWKVDDIYGKNEIDVIARKGDILSFVSCKTTAADFDGSGKLMGLLTDALYEAGYWDKHFGRGTGRVALVVTTDLIDEATKSHRYAALFARAKIANVDLLTGDNRTYKSLINFFQDHWN